MGTTMFSIEERNISIPYVMHSMLSMSVAFVLQIYESFTNAAHFRQPTTPVHYPQHTTPIVYFSQHNTPVQYPQDTTPSSIPPTQCPQLNAPSTIPPAQYPLNTTPRTLPPGHYPQDTTPRTLPPGHYPQDTTPPEASSMFMIVINTAVCNNIDGRFCNSKFHFQARHYL